MGDSLRDALSSIHNTLLNGSIADRIAIAALLENLAKGHIYMLLAMRNDPSIQVRDAANTALANVRGIIESEATNDSK